MSLKSAVSLATTNGKFSKTLMLSKLDSTGNGQHPTNQCFNQNNFQQAKPLSPTRKMDQMSQFRKTELDHEIQEEIELEEENDKTEDNEKLNNHEKQTDDSFINKLIQIESVYLERLDQNLDQRSFVNKQSICSIDTKNLNNVNIVKRLIVDSVDCECESIIKWAMSLPDFNTLSLEDRTNSIEFNFIEVLIINSIWRSLMRSADDVKLVLNKNLILSQTDCNHLELNGIFEHFASIVTKLRNLRIQEEEYLSLKSLVLFKSDYGFQDLDPLETFRNKCFRTLKKSTIRASNQLFEQQNQQQQNQKILSHKYRYESYLILLTDIKSISMRFMHYIIMFHHDFKIDLPPFLKDMFLTQNAFGLTTYDVCNLNKFNKMEIVQQNECKNDTVLMKNSLKNEPSSSSSSSMDDTSDAFTSNKTEQQQHHSF